MASAKAIKSAITAAKLKLETAWAEKDFYTVQQVSNTLYARYSQANMVTELREMLTNGSIRLLQEGEIGSGSELALLLLEHYKVSKAETSPLTIDPLLQIFSQYKLDETHPSKRHFINAAVKWSMNASNNNQGSPALHSAFAEHFEQAKSYQDAVKHYLRSESMDKFAAMNFSLSQAGFPSEQDLFFTGPILMLLALGNLKGANQFMQAYDALLDDNLKKVPLHNFCRFLLLTLERDAFPLFEQLRTKYSLSLQRDPAFSAYLDQIATIFFGVKKRSSNGLGSLMSSLFQSMGNPSASSSSS